MKYECLEFQWIENECLDSGELLDPLFSANVKFNKFSKENDGKFEVIQMSVALNQDCETLCVMIRWL